MTRDEAIKAFHNATENPSSFSDGAWIDRFIALGMLKLDEPKNLRSKSIDALMREFGGHDVETIFGLLEKAGLKIVEK